MRYKNIVTKQRKNILYYIMDSENKYNNYIKKVKVPYLSEYYTIEDVDDLLSVKQDKLVAGNNIEISGSTISAIVPSVDVIDDGTTETGKTWSSNKINSELSNKQNVLTAGDNIEISGDTINCSIPPTLVDSTVSLFTALWKGTQEEYDNLSEHDQKTMYIISEE